MKKTALPAIALCLALFTGCSFRLSSFCCQVSSGIFIPPVGFTL